MSVVSSRLLLVALATALGCGHEWDEYDPRLTGSGGAGASAAASTTSASTSGAGAGPSSAASVSTGAGAAGGTGASGPGGSGSGAGGGGGMATSCASNGTTALQDSFDDGVLGPEWITYTDPGVEIVEKDGALGISVAADPTTQLYGHLISAAAYVFSDCSVAARIVEVPTAPGFGGLLLVSSASFDQRIEIAFAGGKVAFRYWLSNVVTELGGVPYLPSEHVWFRLREASGTTYWETSNDGVHFVTQQSIPTPFDTSSGSPALFGGASDGTRPTGATRFDDFNLLP